MTRRSPLAATAVAVATLGLLTMGTLGAPPAPAVAKKKAAPTVSIKNFAFNPAKPKGTVGQTLTVTNNDGAPHTFTADNASFDLGTVAPGKSKTFKLAKKGPIAFHCNFHPSMKGTLTVA